MKKIFLVVFVLLLLSLFSYFFLFKEIEKTDYRFNTSFPKNGDVKLKAKQFEKEIKQLGLNDTIISSNDYGVTLRLTNKELRKILRSEQVKRYIHAYRKVEDLIPMERTGATPIPS